MLRSALALALLAPGCIALPVIAPPAKASIGIAAAGGNPIPDVDGTPLSDVEGLIVGRVGIVPQSMWPEMNRRPVELEGGYAFQIFTSDNWQRRNRHGVFLGLSGLLGHFWVEANWRVRIVLRGAAEYFVQQQLAGDGGGGSWGLGVEIARFDAVDGETGDALRLLGWLAGEWSLGAELVGGVYSVAGAEYGYGGAAITLRWPGALGLFVIPLSGGF